MCGVAETLMDALQKMNDGTYDFTDHGKCIQCGECCSNLLPMTDNEISKILGYVKKNKIKPHLHCSFLAKPHLDLMCPFLDSNKPDKKCSIYEVRPRVCRDFICDPKQRENPELEYVLSCSLIDVRSTFFGDQK